MSAHPLTQPEARPAQITVYDEATDAVYHAAIPGAAEFLWNKHWGKDARYISIISLAKQAVNVQHVWHRALAHRADANSPFVLVDTAAAEPEAKP